MTESEYVRRFLQLTADEKAIVTGIVTRDICVTTISELTKTPEMAVRIELRDQVTEAIQMTSPAELQHMLKMAREINE